jgi:predicted RNase H-like nuclease
MGGLADLTAWHLPSAGAVLGVDVGYSISRKSSAVCRLDWTETHITWKIKRFGASQEEREHTLQEVAGEKWLMAAAFDSPMRRGLDLIGRYRLAEQMLTRTIGRKIGKPGQSSAPVGKALNAATNLCARTTKDRCRIAPARHGCAIDEQAIVEAFPSSFMGLMIDDPTSINVSRYDRSDKFFAHVAEMGVLKALLTFLLPGRDINQSFSNATNHDERSALICALTALCVAANRFVAVGDEDGWIILPPCDFIQGWAMTDLMSNDVPGRSGLYVSD